MKLSRILIIAALTTAVSSCSSQKQRMAYFTDIDSKQSIVIPSDYNVKIEPSDELLITVTSENPIATGIYNMPADNPATSSVGVGMSQPQRMTYIVNSKGYINFPILGDMYVKGLTVEQLRSKIYDELSKVVEDPQVTVRLESFVVNVAGEVNLPGRYSSAKPRYSILDALSQAGDLTQYGRRDNVLLVREENGEIKHVRFDMNSSDMFSSPYFYLKQNDYVYVEPNDIRKDNAEYNQQNSYKLSVISTIVSGCASIISLIIALSR